MAGIPTHWKKISGSFRIIEITTPDPVLKTIKKGTHVMECVTAGVIAIPSKQVYGTWEFDFYSEHTNNGPLFYPIANKPIIYPNGYQLRYINNDTLMLSTITNGSDLNILRTASSYVIYNTWYRVKITRSVSGVFTFLIKGGAFTPTTGYDGWTLVSVTGGLGTNPVTDTTYTTSEYFVLDLDAGDRIANIQLTDGIKQL